MGVDFQGIQSVNVTNPEALQILMPHKEKTCNQGGNAWES